MDEKKEKLLKLYELFPFEKHPLWQGILKGQLTYEEVIRAEVQHYIRTKAGQTLRREAVEMAKNVSEKIFPLLLQTYLEECTDDHGGPSHLNLIRRLVMQGGWSQGDLDAELPTPGNSAAMALYVDITKRGAGCHMLGAGTVEHFYCQLSPKIFDAYIRNYGMSAEQAETYYIHGPMDQTHAERAFDILDEAISIHGWDILQMSVRDAFVATSLHYDGMLQAATGIVSYWNGRTE